MGPISGIILVSGLFRIVFPNDRVHSVPLLRAARPLAMGSRAIRLASACHRLRTSPRHAFYRHSPAANTPSIPPPSIEASKQPKEPEPKSDAQPRVVPF